MILRYTIVDSALGRLLVAATERGVSAVAMAAADDELRRVLRRTRGVATLVPDDDALSGWASRIVAHLAGRRPRLNLPLDVRATPFQRQVWQALGAIPYGQTRTYGDIAGSIGRPRAARAVARACAANPVAIAIPCHRVVEKGGGLGGYRWGVRRKKALLDRERS
jgi:AraC family transcriptional regulator, regulatory protein of adaptative response / methylated-DNA-[protein]-cysteine methyltransferase